MYEAPDKTVPAPQNQKAMWCVCVFKFFINAILLKLLEGIWKTLLKFSFNPKGVGNTEGYFFL